MIKSALEFYVVSVIFTSPVIFTGLCFYNQNDIRKDKEELSNVLKAILIFSLLPIVNLATAAKCFFTLLTGDVKEDEIK